MASATASFDLYTSGGRLYVAPVGTTPDDQTEWVDLGWTDEGFQWLDNGLNNSRSPLFELPNLPAFDNRDSLLDDWAEAEAEWLAGWIPGGASHGIGRRWPYQGRF